MTFTIRTMNISDLAAIENIQAEAYTGYFLESVDVIAQRFNLSPSTAWVAERDGHVCAYLIGYWSKVGKVNPLNAPFMLADDANCLYLHDLALLRSARGFGLATLLINTAITHALNHSIAACALLSVQNSKEFWQGFGFAEFNLLEKSQRENLNAYVNVNDAAFYMVREL